MKEKKVIQYTAVSSNAPHLLASGVTSMLAKGWEVYGSPMVGADGTYSQAMVKYEEACSHHYKKMLEGSK